MLGKLAQPCFRVASRLEWRDQDSDSTLYRNSIEWAKVDLKRVPRGVSGEFDPNARGVFFGFTLAHTRAHFVHALLEAIAFMIRRDLEGLRRLGVAARELRVLGGGARSRLDSQIKADTCGIPVIVPAQQEAAVLGAAILAAVGVGLYPDINTAVQGMTSGGEPVEPDPANRAVCDRAYKLYVALYDTVKALCPECSEISRMASTPQH